MKNSAFAVIGVFIFLVILWFFSGCSQQTTTTTTSSTTTSTGASPHFLVGTWVGTWEDTYNVSGSLNATISQAGSTLNGTGSIGLAGLNPQGFTFSTESGTAVATLSGSSGTFSFISGAVGLGSGIINGNTISGSGDVVVFADGDFIFIGTVESNGTTINAFFDFLAPGAGQGTARVIKQ